MGKGGQGFRSQGRLIELQSNIVIPAQAGIQCLLNESHWVPAFAGTTILFIKAATPTTQAKSTRQ
jgi:hypothetical protein